MEPVLLVDDDRALREALGQTLELAGYAVTQTGTVIEAKDHIYPAFEGVVISDIRMPGKDGFALLEFVQSVDAELPVILLTGEGDVPMAIRGLREGAYAFLEKPCPREEFLDTIARALRARATVLDNRRMKAQLEGSDAAARLIFGISDAAEKLRGRIRLLAPLPTNLLVHGPIGSGTSKVAEVIHLMSPRAALPFEKRASATLDEHSLARTFSKAGRGTIFLDEIAAMPQATQFALHSFMDGDADARVLAGTYRDLRLEVEQGRFNADLFYRLDGMRVRIPALRERPEDIPVIFDHYVRIACEQSSLPMPEITRDVLNDLLAQEWPGNARALMNTATRFAMGLHDESAIVGMGLAEQIARFEKTILIDALSRTGGNATEAAILLKLPRKTFYDKLQRHQIRAESYR